MGAFNQEKALVGAFSVIVQPVVEPMEHYTAIVASQGNGDDTNKSLVQQTHRFFLRQTKDVIRLVDIIYPLILIQYHYKRRANYPSIQ